MITKLKIEGDADISINELLCVCGFCNNHDRQNATIEFNFRDQKVYYLCSKCKKMNNMSFGQAPLPPMPKTTIMR